MDFQMYGQFIYIYIYIWHLIYFGRIQMHQFCYIDNNKLHLTQLQIWELERRPSEITPASIIKWRCIFNVTPSLQQYKCIVWNSLISDSITFFLTSAGLLRSIMKATIYLVLACMATLNSVCHRSCHLSYVVEAISASIHSYKILIRYFQLLWIKIGFSFI